MVRLTDRPDMTLDVYRGRKTTKQPTKATSPHCPHGIRLRPSTFLCTLPGIYSIFISQEESNSIRLATCPIGFLKFISQHKDP